MGFIFQPSAYELDTALRAAILQPCTPEAHAYATQHNTAFVRCLAADAVLRRGSSVQCSCAPDSTSSEVDDDSTEAKPLSFRVVSTEPVQQGRVQEGLTQVVILPWTAAADEGGEEIDEPGSLEDSWEIDESFLSGTVSRMAGWPCSLHASQSGNDEYSLRVSTRDLGRIGVLHGDWAVASLTDHKHQRLVRVYGAPDNDHPRGAAFADPSLVYNITKSPQQLSSVDISLTPAPLGTSPSRVPVARTVTVARVASPISTDRAYQSSFLKSLHGYFANQRRLVQQDDIIALMVNTDHVRQAASEAEEEPADADSAKSPESQTAFDAPDAPVFFKITNVEYDVIPDAPSDEFYGSMLGEWGCWVDPSVTRILQTGLEQSRVPRPRGVTAAAPTAASRRLQSLVSAALTSGAAGYKLQLSVMLSGVRGIGKMSAVDTAADQLGVHVLEVNCYRLIGENDVQTEGMLRARFEKAAACAPCLLVLRHVDALSQSTQAAEAGKALLFADVISECTEELQQAWNLSGHPTVVVGTTDYPDQLSPRMMSCFKHHIEFNAPDESERASVLQVLLPGASVAPDVSLHDLATQTAALVPSDLADLVGRGERAYLKRAAELTEYDAHRLLRAGANINADDLDTALNKARASYAESIGAPKIPNVTWDDVGGLANVKTDILDTIQLPLEHPELFANGMKKRSGILLYGPPGTGKTLLAKAVATSCALNFFSVKGPELLNMYIGESEANVRRVFQRARDARPCVIFFDELDSVAPKRGNHGDSGGVMDRIVSQLLAELDGIAGGDGGADVFVIGATNRPDLLDPALLRPGRFDRMLYLGVAQTHDAQLHILQALTRRFRLHPALRLAAVADACPFHYTGADLYALCADALLKAMARTAAELDAHIATLNAGTVDPRHPHPLTPQYYLAEMAAPEEIEVLVTQADFESALASLVPSVSQTEMEHYARVQRQFSKETINS